MRILANTLGQNLFASIVMSISKSTVVILPMYTVLQSKRANFLNLILSLNGCKDGSV